MCRPAPRRCATDCGHARRRSQPRLRESPVARPSRPRSANPIRPTGRCGAQGIMEAELGRAVGLAQWKVSVKRVSISAPRGQERSDRGISIVLAGGGTAGHVEPAMAVADALIALDADVRITALGTQR